MFVIPNSWGSLAEANDCHLPAGRPDGGQFCSKAGGRAAPGARRVRFEHVDPSLVKQIFGWELSETALKALGTEMVAGVPGDFDIQISTQMVENRGGGGSHPVLRLWILRSDGVKSSANPSGRRTELTRSFYRDDAGHLVVKHSTFEVSPDAPPGLGKQVLRAHMRTYERLGVHKIQTYANIDVGAYAWAKYGFLAEDPRVINTLIEDGAEYLYGTTVYNHDRHKNPVGRGVGIGDRETRAIKALKSSSRYNVWDLAEFELEGVQVGKALLMASDGWEGYLLLDKSPLSRRQLKRFWSYVGR